MSSLWTPGGEHPVDPKPADSSADANPELDDAIAAALPEGVSLDDLSPEERSRAEEMIREMTEARARLISTPAAAVVANHGMGLYELAALHLSQQPPNLVEATVAIDALDALVGGLEGRLGDSEPTLREALDQLRHAFVQIKGDATADSSSD